MPVYSMDDIHNIVGDVAKQYGVKKVALFSSYSTGKQTSDSDIDLLTDKGEIKGLFMFNSFVNSLKDRLGKDVDVMTYSALERSLIKVKTKQVYFSQSCIPCNRVIIWNQRRKNTSSA